MDTLLKKGGHSRWKMSWLKSWKKKREKKKDEKKKLNQRTLKHGLTLQS